MGPSMEIPGPILFAYMLALYCPEKEITAFRDSAFKAFPFPPSIKPMSLGERDRLKGQMKRMQLPVVCLGCKATIGSMEGGRLHMNCWRCEGQYTRNWERMGTITGLLAPFNISWGHDAIAAYIIASVNSIRANKEKETNYESASNA